MVCFETELSAHALLKKIFVLIKLGSLTVLNILANWMSMFNRENNFKCSVLSRFYSTCGITEKKNYLSRPLFFCFCETKWDHKVQVDHWLLANRILNWPLNVLKYVGDLKTQPYPRSTDQYRHCTCLRCPLHSITAAVTSHDL